MESESATREQALLASLEAIINGKNSEWWAPVQVGVPAKPDGRPAIEWRDQPLPPLPPPQPIAQTREELPEIMRDFLQSDDELLLVGAGAGVGKSHAALSIMQEYGKDIDNTKKAAWFAPRHDLYGTLADYDHFEEFWWHHWMPMGFQAGRDDAACIEYTYQMAWQNAGHRAIDLCKLICTENDHMSQSCKFRLQKWVAEPLIFGMHQHLAFSLPFDFEFIVVDESPIGAMIKERLIKRDDLIIPDTIPELAPIAKKLFDLCLGGVIAQGAELMNELEAELEAAWDWAKDKLDSPMLAAVPQIVIKEQVFDLPTWYWGDLLPLLFMEYGAYRRGVRAFNPHVKTGRDGVMLLDRHSLNENLPRKIIILDATADVQLYRYLFSDWKIRVYAPHNAALGKIHQVVNRRYGNTSDPKQVIQLIEMVRQLRARNGYKDIGIVGHMAHHEQIKAAIPDAKMLYFFNLRGSNSLEHVDALFIAGTPTVHPNSLIRQAIAITGAMEPLGTLNTHGHFESEWIKRAEPYRLKGATLTPYRPVGRYANPILNIFLHQYQAGEIIQALHRARIAVNPSDVWLLTSEPLPMIEIDKLYESPPIAPSAAYPKRDGSVGAAVIPWFQWLKIEPWLHQQHEAGEIVTANALARLAGVKPSTVQNGKWLYAILKNQDHLWIAIDDPNSTGQRGAKRQALKPIDI